MRKNIFSEILTLSDDLPLPFGPVPKLEYSNELSTITDISDGK